MPASSPQFDETVPRPVIAVGGDYPASFELDLHQHQRGQFLYAARGVVAVSTPHGAWIAPSERGVWIPGGTPHAVRMVGAVSTRSVLIDGDHLDLGDRCQVIGVTPLLRQLLVSTAEVEPRYAYESRDGLIMALLIAELRLAPVLPFSAPFPHSAALAARCHAFLEHPSPHDTIDGWSQALGLGRRAFTRTFRRETGLSFEQWRQRACLVVALPRLAAGEPVTAVAIDLGYESSSAFSTMFKRLTGSSPSRYQP